MTHSGEILVAIVLIAVAWGILEALAVLKGRSTSQLDVEH